MLSAYCVDISGKETIVQILDTVWKVKRVRWETFLGRNLQYCEVTISDYCVFLMLGKFNLI